MAPTLKPGDRISHYRIVGPLGVGGMGEVYLAQDLSLERNVALKILPQELVRNEERVRRFMLEARSASSLNHPNIVTIYEIGEAPVSSEPAPGDSVASTDPVSPITHFISMELVTGKTLAALIHGDPDLRTLLGYLAQAAEGLAKAHAAAIVHRDLKPGNIMVSNDGFTKVLDFGLAKLTEKQGGDPGVTSAVTVAQDSTHEGIVLGTAGYMSPEQVQGKSIDHRSDIFSFGCILYEAATRHRPFAAESNIETMHKIVHDKPIPVEELNPSVPAELRRLIRRCLAKAPDQRLHSMKDLAIELREIVEDYDSLSASASSGTTTGGLVADPPLRRRSKLGLVALAIVAGLGMAAGIWGIRRGSKEKEAEPFQSMRMTTLTGRGDIAQSAISMDGRYLAYLAGSGGRSSVHVLQVATGSDVEVVPTQDAPLEGLSFSPDGNYLFYLSRKPDTPSYRRLMQVPSLGGAPRERVFDVDSRVSFSPNGRRVCFRRGFPQKNKDVLIVRDLESGEERVLADIPEGGPGPRWSPDGKRIASYEGRTTTDSFISTLVLFGSEDGRREEIRLDSSFLNSMAWLPDGSGLVATAWGPSSQVFLITIPGGRMRRLTNDFNDYFAVTVSSGDEAIAATREISMANLWVAETAGGTVRQTTSIANPERSPQGFVIPDNDHVLYVAQGDQLWSVPADGGEPRSLTSDQEVSDPHSFDGGIVFERGRHIWCMAADGSNLRQVTRGVGESLVDISRDGRLITFTKQDSTKGTWIVPLAGGDPVLLGSNPELRDGSFSPDGTRVLCFEVLEEEGKIREYMCIVPASGGQVIARFTLPPQATTVRWGPDNESVMFQDKADLAWNVYRQRIDGRAPEPVTRFTEGRILGVPRWSPDGKELAVRRMIGSVENLWVTEADGNHPIQVTQFTSGQIFGFLWMPDSRHIVARQGQTSRDVVLIRDFR